ncbi:like-Sm ribonucleo protein [Schizopora paradoxa]|uniref:Small nuclear ribonucleoprotein G n=1 Tax=Schizopora paradoxa TaxID=27342 RepID=A0A0H2S2J4_9AGAM|nr:like-Sm ribonucleo protein [Schizopora paradoxa]
MSKAQNPELKKFLDKKVTAHMQGGRRATGLLRGYDVFLNIVLDDATEDTNPGQKHELGQIVIRGNSVTLVEPLEPIRDKLENAHQGR